MPRATVSGGGLGAAVGLGAAAVGPGLAAVGPGAAAVLMRDGRCPIHPRAQADMRGRPHGAAPVKRLHRRRLPLAVDPNSELTEGERA